MKKLLIAALAAVAMVGCSSASDAERTLTGAGYKEIKITGYNFFGCGQDDTFHTGFEAVGPSGQRVTGTVCKGFLKGSTIRAD